MQKAVLYVHGKNGSASESKQYEKLFPEYKVYGLEYQSDTPWQFKKEIAKAADVLFTRHGKFIAVANSIGAYFLMQSGLEDVIEKAYFISPVSIWKDW